MIFLGIDIPSCRNVIVFRGLFTPCEYIQTKGRARVENAHLFVFEDPNAKRSLAQLRSLTNCMFSLFKTPSPPPPTPVSFSAPNLTSQVVALCSALSPDQYQGIAEEEIQVLLKGEFFAGIAMGRLNNSISTLYRFCVFSVIDPSLRNARSSLSPLLPIFLQGGNAVILPRHIPQDQRAIVLPIPLHALNRKDKKTLLALIACFRLWKLGVLNKRLLPLSDSKDFDIVFFRNFPASPNYYTVSSKN